MLRGVKVKVTYKRQNTVEGSKASGFDINGDQARLKIFKQFGMLAKTQRFYPILEKDDNDPQSERVTDPNSPGRTVFHYLVQSSISFSSHFQPFGMLTHA